MKLLFVTPRYGADIAAGAEGAAREFATRLAARGHEVHALTSCARSYVDWADVFHPGTSDVDGVTVHRLRVRAPRDDRFFAPLNARAVYGHKPVPLLVQREWMRMQGPEVAGLGEWMAEHAPSFDVAVFTPYLYFTTWAGLPAAAAVGTPTLLHPAAHAEPPFELPLFDTMFRHATGFAYYTEEEHDLVRRRFRLEAPNGVMGIGIDLDVVGDGDAFRAAHGLDDGRPYLLYLGRLDPGKGSVELFDHFVAYKERHPGPLRLVYAGDPVHRLPDHPDVVVLGQVSEEHKAGALAGCLALAQPSYFESFSIVLCEAWAQRRPAIVQGRCDVLAGQARRAGAAFPYRGFAEFEAAVELLEEDSGRANRLGENGRRYVETRYRWDDVLDRYERLLRIVSGRRPQAVL